MARYTGPVCRLCRREQTKLFLKGDKCFTNCVLDKGSSPPGMAKPQRGKPSEFQIRLREKQKLRRMACINEKPFARLVARCQASPVNTGEMILRSLEMRLDNVVRRLGWATSLKAARQLVLHHHVKVGGRSLNIPSCLLKPGDTVSLNPAVKENVGVKLSLETAVRRGNRPSFLEFDDTALTGKVLRFPERAEMSFPAADQLIIEHYSK